MAMLSLTPAELSAVISVNVKSKLPESGVSLAELRRRILFEFEENDKRRGVPYLTVTQPVSMEYKLEYKARIELAEDETPFYGFEDLDFGDEEVEDVVEEATSSTEAVEAEAEEVVEEFYEDEYEEDFEEEDDDSEDEVYEEQEVSIDAFRTFNSRVHTSTDDELVNEGTEEEDVEPGESSVRTVTSTASNFIKVDKNEPEEAEVAPVVAAPKVKPVVKPVTKAPKPQQKRVRPEPTQTVKAETVDAFESMISDVGTPKRPAKRVSPVVTKVAPVVEEKPRNLRELIKKNPGCDVAFAIKYFPKKEIEKQLRLGRVFLKNGRLTI